MAQLEKWQVQMNISAEQPTLSLSGSRVAKPDNTPLCIAPPTFLVSLPSSSSSHTWICISQRRSVHLNPYFQLYFLEDPRLRLKLNKWLNEKLQQTLKAVQDRKNNTSAQYTAQPLIVFIHSIMSTKYPTKTEM